VKAKSRRQTKQSLQEKRNNKSRSKMTGPGSSLGKSVLLLRDLHPKTQTRMSRKRKLFAMQALHRMEEDAKYKKDGLMSPVKEPKEQEESKNYGESVSVTKRLKF